ncbi:hypothetical protein T265_13786, partial [Opisthorchis viverrini]
MIPCHSKLTSEAAMNTRLNYELFSNPSETCSTSQSIPASPNVPHLCCYEHVGDSCPSSARSTTILDDNNNALFRSTYSHRHPEHGSANRRSAMFCFGSLPIILFFVVYFTLVCLGGYCFYLLEIPTERSERLRLHAAQVAFLKTHRCVTSKDLFEFLQHVLRATRMNIIATEIRNMSLYDGLDIPSDWSEKFDSPSLTELLERIGEIAGNDLKAEEEVTGNWNIDQAIFFGMTIVTTIGYGKVSPVTLWGKLFCIIFACLGIPATLVFSSVLINICMGPIRKNRDQLVRRFCRGPGMWQKNSDTRTYSHTLSLDHSAEPNLPMDPPGLPVILPPCELNTHRTIHHAVHFEHHPPNRAEVNDRPPHGPRFSGSMKYRPNDHPDATTEPPVFRAERANAMVPPISIELRKNLPTALSESRIKGVLFTTDRLLRRSYSCPDRLELGAHRWTESPDPNYLIVPTISPKSNGSLPALGRNQPQADQSPSIPNNGSSNMSNVYPATTETTSGHPSKPAQPRASLRTRTMSFNHGQTITDPQHSEFDQSDYLQHSIITSRASFARISFLAMMHFLLSKFDRALVTGLPLSTFRLERKKSCLFRARLLHCALVTFLNLLITIILPAVAFYLIEHGWSFMDAVYFCVISMTTVGLGDLVPSGYDTMLVDPSPMLTAWRWFYSAATTVYLLIGGIGSVVCLSQSSIDFAQT